jgi:murein DD-endopeptidase MepM/ murein hydrolase activator NlpD
VIYSFARSGLNRLAPPVPGATLCGLYPSAWRGGSLVPHPGIDLCAPKGTPIIAVLPGTVVAKTTTEHGGNNFTISHGAFVTYYAHCNRIFKEIGDKVGKFEVVAEVGQTGVNSDGNPIDPHCHFQVMATKAFSSEHYDPVALLDSLGIVKQGLTFYWKSGYPGGLGPFAGMLIGVLVVVGGVFAWTHIRAKR